MRAPITDKHLLEMMWERFPEIMKRGAEQPTPPPECQTEAEKTAFTFGWFKALESVRQQPAQQEPVAKYIGECSDGSLVQLYEDVKKGTDFYTTPPAQEFVCSTGLCHYKEQPAPVQEPLTDSFVQLVPDKCDRIVWRGSYYHLPPAAQRQWVGLTLEDKEEFLALDIGGSRLDAMDWAARKLKEKNT